MAVPAGRLVAGSLPGDEGRDPRAEPVALAVTLAAYQIDRLPYPNDPDQPARTDVGQKEAWRLCAARGERLCSELEWENACKGTGGDAYSSGAAWDPGCAGEPATCASSLGVLGMGSVREWTASDFLSPGKEEKPPAVVRGAAPSADATEHRCAHRAPASPATRARDLGFRCCAGSANAFSIPALKLGPAVRKIALEPSFLAEILGAIPQLASVQASIRYFSEPEDTTTVLKRGRTAPGSGDPEGYTLTTGPVLWNPAPGDEVVLVVGHGTKDSFIVALYRLPENRYRLASSLVFMNDLGPFVLAYRSDVRERLLWSSCWKCAGEGGAISLRDGRRVIIVQQ